MTFKRKYSKAPLLALAGPLAFFYLAFPFLDKPAIHPPFDVAVIRSVQGTADKGPFRCDAPPPPMRDLEFESVYGDLSENASIVDEQAYTAYKEKTASITLFEQKINSLANRYVRSRPPRPEIAACALRWLKTWAKEDALLGHTNAVGEFVRKWVLASASLAYLQIEDEPSLNPNDKKRAERWLKKVSKTVIKDFSRSTDKNSRKNNHLYWAAWGVAATAAALDDQRMFDWAMDKAKFGISQIQKDGTLPLELNRGRKAFNYHVFAAIPLFMLAEMGSRNGINLYAENNEALKRLGTVILENAKKPDYFFAMTGEKQDMTRAVTNSNMTWLEPYNLHYPGPENAHWLEKFRPLRQSRVGGDATLLYGSY